MNKTNISWVDYTWNPITGCTMGCEYCYASKIATRFKGGKAYPKGFEPTEHPDRLYEPSILRKPSIIFVGSMGDIFDPIVSFDFIDKIFEEIEEHPRHTFMLLTKQSWRMYAYMKSRSERYSKREFGLYSAYPDNLWLGVTATTQGEYYSRVRNLLDIPHKHTFVSIEPILGRIDDVTIFDQRYTNPRVPKYMIVGAETPGKPLHITHPAWLDRIIKECEYYGIALHYKHAGGKEINPEYKGKVYNALIDGRLGK